MVLGIGTFISDMMVAPFQSPVFGSPKDFGLGYEDVEFQTSDGVTLRGWLVKGEGNDKKKVIVQSHYGVQCCRSGYTPDGKGMMPPFPDKIEFLNSVPTYAKNGYSVLMYDLRNHGNSDPGTQAYVSWGPNEAADVAAAVKYVAKDFSQISLLSICMGGASTVYAFGSGELEPFNDKIKSMVVIQPLTYRQMITNMGMPTFFESMSTPVTKERLGFALDDQSPFDHTGSVSTPTLVVQNNNDPFHKKEEVQSFFDGLASKTKEMKWLDLGKTRFHNYAWLSTQDGADTVVNWFNKFSS